MLDAKTSLAVAGGAATVVYATFSAHLPTLVDERAAAPNDAMISGAVKSAAWMSTAAVVGLSLITKDATVFAVGAATIVALVWLHRHANAYDPGSGRASMPTAAQLRNNTLSAGAGTTPGN